MDKNVAALWTEALRSGEFVQQRYTLKAIGDSGKVFHCCLGVLCELYNRHNPESKMEELHDSRVLVSFNRPKEVCVFDGERDLLPLTVMRWANITTKDCTFEDEVGTSNLVKLNDGSGWSFELLADCIDNNYQKM